MERMPDRALMQGVLDAWATLNPTNVAPFYAKGEKHFLRR